MQKVEEGRGASSVVTLGFMVSAVMDGALLYDMARAGTGDSRERQWETRRQGPLRLRLREREREDWGVRCEEQKDGTRCSGSSALGVRLGGALPRPAPASGPSVTRVLVRLPGRDGRKTWCRLKAQGSMHAIAIATRTSSPLRSWVLTHVRSARGREAGPASSGDAWIVIMFVLDFVCTMFLQKIELILSLRMSFNTVSIINSLDLFRTTVTHSSFGLWSNSDRIVWQWC